MQNNIHNGHRDRLRDKAINNINNLEEHEVLEMLLSFVIPYKDTNPIAHSLIDKFGSFYNVLNANINELTKVKGVGEKTAKFINLLTSTYTFYSRSKAKEKTVVKNTSEAIKYVKNYFDGLINEQFYLFCLDPSNVIIDTQLVANGNAMQVPITIRTLTEICIRNNCHNIIIAHNHPNGNANPSHDDDKLTKAIVIGMAINSIAVLDHIIIGNNSSYSYNLSGNIALYSKEVDSLISSASQNYCKYNQ